VARAGLEERGQIMSKEVVKVEHKVSVAVFTFRDDNFEGEGREDDNYRWTSKKKSNEKPFHNSLMNHIIFE